MESGRRGGDPERGRRIYYRRGQRRVDARLMSIHDTIAIQSGDPLDKAIKTYEEINWGESEERIRTTPSKENLLSRGFRVNWRGVEERISRINRVIFWRIAMKYEYVIYNRLNNR